MGWGPEVGVLREKNTGRPHFIPLSLSHFTGVTFFRNPGKALHQHSDHMSLHHAGLEPDPQYLQGVPVVSTGQRSTSKHGKPDIYLYIIVLIYIHMFTYLCLCRGCTKARFPHLLLQCSVPKTLSFQAFLPGMPLGY